MKLQHAIPLHFFKDEALEKFQLLMKDMFLSEDRTATKAYMKLFIEKIVITLPRIDITCKSNVLLETLENKTAARSAEVLAADISWLPSLMSQSVLLWDGASLDMKRMVKGHTRSSIYYPSS